MGSKKKPNYDLRIKDLGFYSGPYASVAVGCGNPDGPLVAKEVRYNGEYSEDLIRQIDRRLHESQRDMLAYELDDIGAKWQREYEKRMPQWEQSRKEAIEQFKEKNYGFERRTKNSGNPCACEGV